MATQHNIIQIKRLSYETFIAATEVEKMTVYVGRYRYLKSQSLIPHNPQAIYTDKYDGLENTYMFAVKHKKILLGSLRGIINSSRKRPVTPNYRVFEDIIKQNLKPHQKYMTLDLLSPHPLYRKDLERTQQINSKVIFEASRVCHISNCDYLVTAVTSDKLDWYRSLGFRRVSKERPHSEFDHSVTLLICFNPIRLMRTLSIYFKHEGL